MSTIQISGSDLDKHLDFIKALEAFNTLFNYENKDERAIVILGGTFLDMALEHLLYSFLPKDEKEVKKLFDYGQPLGSFGNKINISYCLGLIDKVVKSDLELVRKIRNKFAHNLYVNFRDNQIKSWVRELKFHRISMMMNPPEGATELQIFQVGVNQLITNLHAEIRHDDRRPIKDYLSIFLEVN